MTIKRFQVLPVIAAAVFLCIGCGALTQVSEQEKAEYIKAIKSHNYTLSITTVVPQGYPSYQVSGDFEMRVKKDKVDTRLPYVGDSHQAIIAGADELSIVFEDSKVSFKDDFSKKTEGKYITCFTADTGNTKWEVTLELYDEGSATIKCSSPTRGYMSYYAEIVTDDK